MPSSDPSSSNYQQSTLTASSSASSSSTARHRLAKGRIARELKRLHTCPPDGVKVDQLLKHADQIDLVSAGITGPVKSPYHGFDFWVTLDLSKGYPWEPPRVRFNTPIYHPNIDRNGYVCLDLLKLPPTGQWRPTSDLALVLASLRTLLASPIPKESICADIAEEFTRDRSRFEFKAREHAQLHALRNGKRPVGDKETDSGFIAGGNINTLQLRPPLSRTPSTFGNISNLTLSSHYPIAHAHSQISPRMTRLATISGVSPHWHDMGLNGFRHDTHSMPQLHAQDVAPCTNSHVSVPSIGCLPITPLAQNGVEGGVEGRVLQPIVTYVMEDVDSDRVDRCWKRRKMETG